MGEELWRRMVVSLIDMEKGETGKVVALCGGRGFQRNMESLGIRPGAMITKKSVVLGRGPIIIEIGGTEIAVGSGKAVKVKVEVMHE